MKQEKAIGHPWGMRAGITGIREHGLGGRDRWQEPGTRCDEGWPEDVILMPSAGNVFALIYIQTFRRRRTTDVLSRFRTNFRLVRAQSPFRTAVTTARGILVADDYNDYNYDDDGDDDDSCGDVCNVDGVIA